MMHIVHLFSTSSYQKLSCICVFSSSSNDIIFFSDGGYVNISLENYNTSSIAGRLIKDVKQILPLSTIILNVIRIPETVRFIVVQAHTFQYNVTLSYDAILSPHSFINGTNLGLVQLISKNQSNATFYIQNTNARPSITVLITVQGYGEEAPVPGGCNVEFSVKTAPYLIISFTESLIFVDSQPASAAVPYDKPRPACEPQVVQHEMYHMFLPERDFSSDSYFDALLKMMTVEDIQLNGRKVLHFRGFYVL
ncbi:hypothetical protein B7P43_G12734 [Cryptotermes secundus]|uniref:Uncharacterized protein n=1 Tax=Cryptotermes secundus TaxID=105785 RepID=A0A2J7PYY2_9NEOP|nr:hypothetical protein B7P43_G12734 [Cryptotermes secundus]